MSIKISATFIKDLLVIEGNTYDDHRGYFREIYNEGHFNENGLSIKFIQDNLSYSVKNTIRGLHAQENPGQDKLVRCIKGKIIDVAVDIRKDSPTYLKHFKIELEESKNLALLIPQGFLHGFSVISDDAIVAYKVSGKYNKSGEIGINPFTEILDIDWCVSKDDAIVSDKDIQATKKI